MTVVYSGIDHFIFHMCDYTAERGVGRLGIERGDRIDHRHIAAMHALREQPTQAGKIRVEAVAVFPVWLTEMEIWRCPLPPTATGRVVKTMQIHHRGTVGEVLVESRHHLGRRCAPAAGMEALQPDTRALIEMGDRAIHLEPLEGTRAMQLWIIAARRGKPTHGAEIVAVVRTPGCDSTAAAVIMSE